jgi:hypothetical protein
MKTHDPIEDALADLQGPPPPPDLLARCLASVAESPRPAPVLRSRVAWFPLLGATGKRLAVGAAVIAALAFWSTRPAAPPSGDAARRPAPAASPGSAAFAQTLEAMQRVTYWRSTSQSVSGGWNRRISWFDAQRGRYSEEPHQSGAMMQRDLLLTSGDWYVRQASNPGGVRDGVRGGRSGGSDKVRLTHMGAAFWQRQRDEQMHNIRRPSFWAANLGQLPAAPSAQRRGRWNGRPALIFTFRVPPPARMQRQGFSRMTRTEVYVDPVTKLLIASQQFSRPPATPALPDAAARPEEEKGEQEEQLTGQQEWDFSQRPDAALFDPERFIEGADAVQEQTGGPGVTLSPQ